MAGGALGDWLLALAPLAGFGAVVVALLVAGRAPPETPAWLRPAGRIGASLERVTGMPGWAAGAVGSGLFGLLIAAIGFYWDVAWHIDLGRDEQLLTPAHTMIVLGLGFLVVAAGTGATLALAGGGPRGRRRVPWSVLPLAVLGIGGLGGFPMDEVWHRFYGIDVTLWSPTHLLMVGGASLAPIALWLVLAEADVRPEGGRWARGAHLTVAWAALVGLSSFQAEFDFGVPQFQLLYQPVLVAGAAGLVLVAARLALGRGGAVAAAVGFLAFRSVLALVVGPGLGHTVPRFPLYLTAAVAVEVVVSRVGARRPVWLGMGCGVGIATFGLAGEWAWMALWGRHPWGPEMLPQAIAVGGVAAVGAALLGVALGRALAGTRERVGAPGLLAAAALLVAALAVPLPRTVGEVRADLALQGDGERATVRVLLDPPDAAEEARWFEALAWQGGGLVRRDLLPVGPGRYVTEGTVPVGGAWKTVVRLHRGSEVMAVPVAMPADPTIGAPAIPAADRSAEFVADRRLLLREVRPGPRWPAVVIGGLLGGVVVAWMALLAAAGARVGARYRIWDQKARATTARTAQ